MAKQQHTKPIHGLEDAVTKTSQKTQAKKKQVEKCKQLHNYSLTPV